MFEEGALLMSATAKLLGAASAGAFASWLLEGDYSIKGFMRLFASLIIAAFMAIMAVYFISGIADAPELVKIGTAGVVGAFSADIFKRITRADLSLTLGPIKAESDGKEPNE